MQNLMRLGCWATGVLNRLGDWFAPLLLRVVMAHEFWESGMEKLSGQNWFAEIQADFPWPFALLPVALSWWLATWTELVGAAALLAGLGTRFAAFALMVIDFVAWWSVHAGPDCGYTPSGCGYKLPLLFMVMLAVLLLQGGGKLSLDYLIVKRLRLR